MNFGTSSIFSLSSQILSSPLTPILPQYRFNSSVGAAQTSHATTMGASGESSEEADQLLADQVGECESHITAKTDYFESCSTNVCRVQQHQ